MQQVDGLTPFEYLIETAKQNIEGDITIEEVKQRIDTYYKQQSNETDAERTEEAEMHSSASLPLRFLENLLFGEKHILKNREMHVHYEEIVKRESSEKKGDQKR